MIDIFNNLTNFAYKRTTKQALGFYIAYLLLIVICGALLGGVSALIVQDPVSFATRAGSMLAVVMSVTLAFMLLKAKNLHNNFLFIILALFSGLLALFGGGLLGLIPATYISTK